MDEIHYPPDDRLGRVEFRVDKIGDMAVQSRTEIKLLQEDSKDYVTQDAFRPVRMIAYGLTATILTAVLLSVLKSAHLDIGSILG